MALRQTLRHTFTSKYRAAKNQRGWADVCKQAIFDFRGYEELIAQVYLEVLSMHLKNKSLLLAFQATLEPGKVARPEQLQPTIIADSCMGLVSNNGTIPIEKYLSIINKLVGWVEFNRTAPYSAKARFIAGVVGAIICALSFSDNEKIEAMRSIQGILEDVSASDLAETWAFTDTIKDYSGVGSETFMHYPTQINDVIVEMDEIIVKESVATTEKQIEQHQGSINRVLNNIPAILPRLLYNLFGKKTVPALLSFHGFEINNTDLSLSFLTLGIQQIIQLEKPHKELNQGEFSKKINFLNDMIQFLGGNHYIEFTTVNIPEQKSYDKSSDVDVLESKSNDHMQSAQFIQNLRVMLREGRLVLDERGRVKFYEKIGEASEPKYILPSGFSDDLLTTPETRAGALADYLELLALIQELQNCLELLRQYLHYMNYCGMLGVFSMLPASIHEHLDTSNVQPLKLLNNRIIAVHKKFETPVKVAKSASIVRKNGAGKERKDALETAKDSHRTLQTAMTTIEDQAKEIKTKRGIVVTAMVLGRISFKIVTKNMLESIVTFQRCQNILGYDIQCITDEAFQNTERAATRFDRARGRIVEEEIQEEKKEVADASVTGGRQETSVRSSSSLALTVVSQSSESRSISPESSSSSRTPSPSFLRPSSPSPRHGSSSAAILTVVSSEQHEASPERKNRQDEVIDEVRLYSIFSELHDNNESDKTKNDLVRAHTKRSFNEAWAKLGYKKFINELDPVVLFKSYILPKDQPEIDEKASIENRFNAMIDSKNAVAMKLQSDVISVWQNMFMPWRWDRHYSRTARLVLCNEMCELFEQALMDSFNSGEINLESINRMYDKMNVTFENQKQYWNGTFNTEIAALQVKLADAKNKMLENFEQLTYLERNFILNPKAKMDLKIKNVTEQRNKLARIPGNDTNPLKCQARQVINNRVINIFVEENKKLNDQIGLEERLFPPEMTLEAMSSNPFLLDTCSQIGDELAGLIQAINTEKQQEGSDLQRALDDSLKMVETSRTRLTALTTNIVRKNIQATEKKAAQEIWNNLKKRIENISNPFVESKDDVQMTSELMKNELDILKRIRSAIAIYIETVSDEDSLDKLQKEIVKILIEKPQLSTQTETLISEIIKEYELESLIEAAKLELQARMQVLEEKKPPEPKRIVMSSEEEQIKTMIEIANAYICTKLLETRISPADFDKAIDRMKLCLTENGKLVSTNSEAKYHIAVAHVNDVFKTKTHDLRKIEQLCTIISKAEGVLEGSVTYDDFMASLTTVCSDLANDKFNLYGDSRKNYGAVLIAILKIFYRLTGSNDSPYSKSILELQEKIQQNVINHNRSAYVNLALLAAQFSDNARLKLVTPPPPQHENVDREQDMGRPSASSGRRRVFHAHW